MYKVTTVENTQTTQIRTKRNFCTLSERTSGTEAAREAKQSAT